MSLKTLDIDNIIRTYLVKKAENDLDAKNNIFHFLRFQSPSVYISTVGLLGRIC